MAGQSNPCHKQSLSSRGALNHAMALSLSTQSNCRLSTVRPGSHRACWHHLDPIRCPERLERFREKCHISDNPFRPAMMMSYPFSKSILGFRLSSRKNDCPQQRCGTIKDNQNRVLRITMMLDLTVINEDDISKIPGSKARRPCASCTLFGLGAHLTLIDHRLVESVDTLRKSKFGGTSAKV